MVTPTDTKLYSKVKDTLYKKYPKHSAYRSGILVKTYKAAFSAKYGKLKSPYVGKKPLMTGLSRWFKEKWVADDGKIGYSSKDSVYRPTKRITKKTPVTFSELSVQQISAAKKEKAGAGRVKRFSTI